MSTPSFDPQPCEPDGPDVPQEVTIVGPLPVPVDVVSPDPLNVNVTNQLSEPVDVNVVSPIPLTVGGTVSVNEPVDVNVLGTVTVTGTISSGGSTVASTTLTTATTGNGTTIDFTAARSNVSLFIMVNGTVTSGVVDMQASQDGVNWVKVASSTVLSTGVNQRIGVSDGAFRWFRGVVSENVVGGGTVTATLMFA